MLPELTTQSDLERLIGETEAIDLEFKGPEDFLAWPQTKDKIAEDLSKQVSAFANSYGGQIVIGVKEARDSHRAEMIVGVDPNRPGIQNLQRLVEGNLRPRLEGIRYSTIPLSGASAGRVIYVIAVPQGKTAYQARDNRYYGRSEYESVPLEDQLIRYKMVRERLAEATIEVEDVRVDTAERELERRQSELTGLRERQETGSDLVLIPRQVRERLEAPLRNFDRYGFHMSIANTGPITIRDCALTVKVDGLPPGSAVVTSGDQIGLNEWLFRMAEANRIVTIDRGGMQTAQTVQVKLFPSQKVVFPGASFTVDVPAAGSVAGVTLAWTLYLEDSPQRSGSLSLDTLLASAAESSLG